ncbi:hypothetical protein CANCADRAFT_57386 [Tortispora caseinolytica NRRL Y-17796]|uniref:Zn(2)-C6 fungal-type domain-containing protein n=1 Tax=Tortispora caseinolytica NRRL Y-17796 TaxID=767744 RepID=A0A1E4TGX4_9ASCO|nr:hypothetical protein CANCADRAFT_57386 [Tortispora caseinolytica NRRL Y-17796]
MTPSRESAGAKHIACVECRQQKVKCDSHEMHPNACSRCALKGISCIVQRDYRRRNKRVRLEQVEKEFQELKKAIASTDSIPSTSTMATTWDAPISLDISNTDSHSDHKSNLISWTALQTPCDSKTISDLTLSTEDIQFLFKHFAIHYQHHMPIADLTRAPSDIFDLSPLLFWVIIFTALRRLPDAKYRSIYDQLAAKIKSLVTVTFVHPDEPFPRLPSVYSVQALLIYTLWPPMSYTVGAITSWTTAGLAMFTAVRIGLHRPGRAQDFDRVKVSHRLPEVIEIVRTWIACNIVSEYTSFAFGYPSFSQHETTVALQLQLPSAFAAPPRIQFQAKCLLLYEQILTTITYETLERTDAAGCAERDRIIRSLSLNIDTFESTYPNLDVIDQLSIQLCRSSLSGLYLMDYDTDYPKMTYDRYVKAYSSSLAVLKLVIRADSMYPNFLTHSIIAYFFGLVMAMCIIMRLIVLPFLEDDDFISVKQIYFQCITLIRDCSFVENDMAAKLARVLGNSWKMQDTRSQKFGATPFAMPTMSIRTRGTMSVIYDSLWAYRNKYGAKKLIVPGKSTKDSVKPMLGEIITGTDSNKEALYFNGSEVQESEPATTANSFSLLSDTSEAMMTDPQAQDNVAPMWQDIDALMHSIGEFSDFGDALGVSPVTAATIDNN